MTSKKTILVAGTYDTKDDELHYLAEVILGQGGGVLSMDVSVLGEPSRPTDVSKHAVAEAGGASKELATISSCACVVGRRSSPVSIPSKLWSNPSIIIEYFPLEAYGGWHR